LTRSSLIECVPKAAGKLFAADGQSAAADGLVFLRIAPALFRCFEIQFIQPDGFGGSNSGDETRPIKPRAGAKRNFMR